MHFDRLRLYSEPYSPSGNMAANGARRLLGAPRLGLLQTVIRESVQNCCDAAKLGVGPRVRFRLRRLSPEQLAALEGRVLTDLPDDPEASDPIREFFASPAPWVLEICDFGTTGLAGPTRADRPPAPGERTDFVNFIRDIGIKRDTELGGGTYGFGKSALYLASRCSLIIVDTQTRNGGQLVRRLIGAQLGGSFVAGHGDSQRRYTGRHWWGVLDDIAQVADPLEGEAAAVLAGDLGMPARSAAETGTTIMIVAPQFIDDNIRDAAGAIQEALLWNFWPRMMADAPAARRLDVALEIDGADYPIPAPEETPPLDHFCDAMRGIRSGAPSVETVSSARPAKVLGRLHIVKGIKGDRLPLRSDGESLFPETCRHIAVMRPVELVVRYFDDGEPLQQAGSEWAGVFVTSEEKEVEKAFADAEPPAHDDWLYDMLPKKTYARTYVRVALSRIRDAAQAVVGGQAPTTGGHRDAPSLAHVADMFGRALASANAQGAGPRTGKSGGGGSGGRAYSISRPVFQCLAEENGNPLAIFRADIRNPAAHRLTLRLQPSIVIDGGGSASDIGAEGQPRVIAVRSGAEEVAEADGEFALGTFAGALDIAVSLPEDGAITLKAGLSEGGDT